MPLQVLPVDGPADTYRCAVIENHAYGTYSSNDILFPGPFAPDALVTRGKELQGECAAPNTFFFKVVDTDIEEEEGAEGAVGQQQQRMIAFSKWTVHDGRESNETTTSVPPKRELLAGANAEACAMFFGSLAGMRERNMGSRPHIFLSTLNTDPKHNGRGAGTLLLQWGLEEGARRGLPVYLHSALQAHSLYLKHGFRDLEELVTDFSPWGLEERNYNWAMIKEP